MAKRTVLQELEIKQRDLSQITDENRLLMRFLIAGISRVLWISEKEKMKKMLW